MIHARNGTINVKDREGFLNWLHQNTNRLDIKQFIDTGVLAVLGGFNPMSPTSHPGWIVQAITRFKVHNIAITLNVKFRWLHIWLIDEVPWKNFIGVTGRDWNIYDGDDPSHSIEMREKLWKQ
jgi:hypothetical protein